MYSHEFGRMLDGHIDPEVISDLVGGLLTREQAASLERHFMTCAECRDMRDSLAQVRHLLSHLPVEPMPADVAERIDSALAAEVRRREAEAEEPTPARPGGRTAGRQSRRAVRSLAAARQRRASRLPAMAKAAAAVAVVVTGGVMGFAIVDGLRSDQRDTTASSQAPTENQLGAAGGAESPSFALTKRTYTKAGLDAEVRALLTAGRGAAATKGVAPAVPAPQDRSAELAEGTPLRPCLLAATGRPQALPIVVDIGTYQGKPATVIVLPDAKDPARVDVYVVDSTCTGGKGRVLDSRQVRRP